MLNERNDDMRFLHTEMSVYISPRISSKITIPEFPEFIYFFPNSFSFRIKDKVSLTARIKITVEN